MSGIKKNIFNGAFLLLVLLITLYSVFHGENLSELLIYLKQGDFRYWLLGAVFVVGFIESESVIIYYMMKVLGENVKLTHCFLYSFVGFFFSLITPSATGGQPAQLYFMKKDKLSLPTSTMVLLIVTITYKLVLVVLGLVVMILRPEPVWRLLKPIYGWCYLGIFLNVVCVFGMLILVFHPTLASNIVLFCLRLFDRIFKKDMEKKYGGRLERAMEKYRYAAEFFYKNIKVIVNVFLITCVQRFLLFAVTYLVYRSFSLNLAGAGVVITLQGMISVAVDMLPLPGGLGISEKLFKDIFLQICTKKYTLPVMIVSRGLSFYVQLGISAVMTVVAYLRIGSADKILSLKRLYFRKK